MAAPLPWRRDEKPTELSRLAPDPRSVGADHHILRDAAWSYRTGTLSTDNAIRAKKYVVKLNAAEREQLDSLIHTGKHPAQKLMKARILLKADAAEGGEALSDSQIATALNTSLATIPSSGYSNGFAAGTLASLARTRQQLVEEGFEAVLTRKHSPASARPRIFDGASEAKLIALACSEPPKGRARWTLSLLEDKVVELNIVAKASDNTIGRTLKKTLSNHI